MAEVTRLSSKGQLVIPQDIRAQLHLEPGDTFAVEARGDVVVLRRLNMPDDEEWDAIFHAVEEGARRAALTRPDVEGLIHDDRGRRRRDDAPGP